MLKIQIMDMLLPWLLKTGGKLLITVLIAVIGYKVIRAIRKGVGRSMEKAGLEVTLRKFLDALLYAVLIGLLVFMVAEELGIKSSSLVTIAGAVTLAMSLSLQNTMANFAGGVLVLFLKPFKAGDYIVTKDGEGAVESIGRVYTTLLTIENKRIVIPNSSISNSPITNSTGEEKKKLVLNIGIGYSADLKKAKEILRRLFEEHPAILKEDGILVVVDSLGESSVNLSVRGWTLTEEYWTARWELTEAVKLAFDEEGIEIPYNYLNVHLTEKQKQSGQA